VQQAKDNWSLEMGHPYEENTSGSYVAPFLIKEKTSRT
jgi:hypothetical protein